MYGEEMYLEPRRTSTMELFWENSLLAVNHFRQKGPL